MPRPPLRWLWRAPDNAEPFGDRKSKPVERCERCDGKGRFNLSATDYPLWVDCSCHQRICPSLQDFPAQHVKSMHDSLVPPCRECNGYGFQVAMDVGVKY